MPGVSYDAAFEVTLSIEFTSYHIPERACIAVEPFRGHLSIVCVGDTSA
jgi:hypothetical protein